MWTVEIKSWNHPDVVQSWFSLFLLLLSSDISISDSYENRIEIRGILVFFPARSIVGIGKSALVTVVPLNLVSGIHFGAFNGSTVLACRVYFYDTAEAYGRQVMLWAFTANISRLSTCWERARTNVRNRTRYVTATSDLPIKCYQWPPEEEEEPDCSYILTCFLMFLAFKFC